MKILQTVVIQIRTFPWKRQSIPCACIMGGGDIVAQLLVEKRRVRDVDWFRIGRFAVLGFFPVGPVMYKWYEFLENRFGKRGIKTIAKKVLCDQIFFGPTITVMVLCGLQIVNGAGMQGIKKTMNEDFVEVLITTYKFYPILQIFNFWLIPLRGQVLVDQAASVAWNAYISWQTQTRKSLPPRSEQTNDIKDL